MGIFARLVKEKIRQIGFDQNIQVNAARDLGLHGRLGWDAVEAASRDINCSLRLMSGPVSAAAAPRDAV